MQTIIPEFEGSIERIRNNFYFSFLAVNFINQRPFYNDIVLPLNSTNNIMSANSINSFDQDGVTEYGNSIRRHFLNDMVIAYERYSMLMIASHQNGQIRTEPETLNNRNIGANNFEQLANVYSPNELIFLVQLRRLRNCIVHFNGHYSVTNQLNYTFGTNIYNSLGNEGNDISIEFDSILWIFDELTRIVRSGNANYFSRYIAT
jgi:hypothetical protein